MYELRDFSDVAPETTVATDITNATTNIAVANGTGYPAGGASGDFMIQIESELIRCSSRSGNNLVVSGGVAGRGQNGTTATNHVTGVAVNHVLTAINDAKEANRAVAKTIGVATTAGDILVADTANSFKRLGIGANGTILQALSGAVQYGALPIDSVGSAQISTGAVGSDELAANAVIAGKIAPGGINNSNQFATGVIDSNAILDLSIQNGDIATATLTDAKFTAANKDGTAGTPSLRTLGTGAAQATAGNDSRLSDSRTPTGTAGGDLTGTYPNPTIGAGKVTQAAVSSEAGTAWTPTLNGSGWALGNGTATGLYLKYGRLIHVQCKILFGSTSSYGSSALSIGGLPTSTNTSLLTTGLMRIVDVSDHDYGGFWYVSASGTSGELRVGGQFATPGYLDTEYQVKGTVPHTWASGDSIELTMTYIASA